LKYQITPEELDEFFSALDFATRVVPSSSIPLPVRDEKDKPILATATGGNADYLVTGDLDLLVLRDDPRIGSLQIVTVNQFLEKLET
jgi:putative PIN family toxin of toxin-antitoxin system